MVLARFSLFKGFAPATNSCVPVAKIEDNKKRFQGEISHRFPSDPHSHSSIAVFVVFFLNVEKRGIVKGEENAL